MITIKQFINKYPVIHEPQLQAINVKNGFLYVGTLRPGKNTSENLSNIFFHEIGHFIKRPIQHILKPNIGLKQSIPTSWKGSHAANLTELRANMISFILQGKTPDMYGYSSWTEMMTHQTINSYPILDQRLDIMSKLYANKIVKIFKMYPDPRNIHKELKKRFELVKSTAKRKVA